MNNTNCCNCNSKEELRRRIYDLEFALIRIASWPLDKSPSFARRHAIEVYRLGKLPRIFYAEEKKLDALLNEVSDAS